MFIAITLLAVLLYGAMLVVCLGPRALSRITPSTFVALAIAIQCSPLCLLNVEDGFIVTDYFRSDAIPVLLQLSAGYCLAVIIYFIGLRPIVLAQQTRLAPPAFPAAEFHVGSRNLAVFLMFVAGIYIFLTPRLGMLSAVWQGLLTGESNEMNYMRRVEFAGGFFNQKVFTWIRFSLSPFISLFLLSCLIRKKGYFAAAVAIPLCYGLYFAMSASFHKSTWVMGFVYIGAYVFMHFRGNGIHPRQYWRTFTFCALALAGFIVLLGGAYLLQYRQNDSLSLGYHIAGSISRVTNAVPWGLAAFNDVFPQYVPFEPEQVLLAPFVDGGVGPESAVAFSLGLETTIQPGVLANLYAGVGWLSIPLYWLYVAVFCSIADFVTARIRDDIFRRMAIVLLGLSLAWNVQMPLYPSLFSSGLFVNVVVFALIIIAGSGSGHGRPQSVAMDSDADVKRRSLVSPRRGFSQ